MHVLFFCYFIRITFPQKTGKNRTKNKLEKQTRKTKKTKQIRAPFADSNCANLKFCLKSQYLHKTSTIAK